LHLNIKVSANHPAFSLLETVSEDDTQENGLSGEEIGKIKYSFANLLALYRPLIIIDEAHNARTALTFETLKRVHPAAIIEFTATPNTSPKYGSNILFHVSASELKAEEMIKLPIVLTEHQNWQDAIQDSVITRNKLEIDAQKDTDYIRPIALFQAEPKNGEVTVDVLKAYLVDELKIDENKIAVVTGHQRELDGINLFDYQCSIEYIITIEALKEGWDCSFAYVFCSVKQVSSSKDAEQLLGRVLRMPYAKRRVIEDLNRAYAHLASSRFSQAAQELTDKLISMGFEEMEVAAFLKQQTPTIRQGELFNPDDINEIRPTFKPAVVVELAEIPDISTLSPEETAQMSMTQQDDTAIIRIQGEVTKNIQTVLERQMTKKKDKDTLQRNIRVHNLSLVNTQTPSERGEIFGVLPQLCLQLDGELELIESTTFEWSLLDYPAELANFRLEETTNSFSIDMDGKKLSYKIIDEKSLVFNQGTMDVTENDLVRWLDRKLRQPDIIQFQLIQFLSRLVKKLLQQPNLTLTALIRSKFPLSNAIKSLIKLHRKDAQRNSYQTKLFESQSTTCLSDEFIYEFKPDYYPSRQPYYSGRYKFQKHFFPQNLMEDLKSQGEEYECAKAIDGISSIKHWIRNLVRRNQASFWLPLAHAKFYPDFICELKDGRMLIVEYKGEAYHSNDDSSDKRIIGQKWAELSKGHCLFIMAVKYDKKGRDVRQQILNIIESSQYLSEKE